AAYLKARGHDVGVFDTTFATRGRFDEELVRTRPTIVGIYTNMLTRRSVLALMARCKAHGALVVLGGPEPKNYAREYLAHAADIVAQGEGELTMAELVPHLIARGARGLEHIAGILFRDDNGEVHDTGEREFLPDLDALPWPARDAIDLSGYLATW